jgi:hypothetical protein
MRASDAPDPVLKVCLAIASGYLLVDPRTFVMYEPSLAPEAVADDNKSPFSSSNNK